VEARYIGVSDEAVDNGGERAGHGQSVAGESTNGGSYPCRDYHHARVVPLKLRVQTQTKISFLCPRLSVNLQTAKIRRESVGEEAHLARVVRSEAGDS
jgi:hypothetical protein